TVTDAEEDIPVTITGGVDMEVPGTYTLQYDATDTAGNDAATVTRTIRIVERSSGRGGYQPSKNANLAQLTVKADKDELSLTPKFTSGTTHYEAETTADAITIEAIPSDANAVVFLDEAPHDKARTIALTVGDNEFEIKVRAESGTLKTYAVTIHRAATPLEPKPENPACTFRDIEGHWAEPIICEALNVGIVEGRSETTFQPEAYITRVEFAAILLRTLGINSRPAGDGLPFADQERIPSWATDVVSAAAENGVLQGYPDRTLQPLRHVNRSEMVAMIAKAMKWKLEPGDTSFEDDTDIPDWARGYVNGAVQRNLVHGRDGDRFSPMEPATRAEASALLLRLWHLLSPRSLT
ncbi:MAG: hypothetical protein K0Q63_3574, partial [Paenibacillus sp.]|nr:hypothetical protein [Paenibacillus sp.]